MDRHGVSVEVRNADAQRNEMDRSNLLTPLVSLLFLDIPKSLANFHKIFPSLV